MRVGSSWRGCGEGVQGKAWSHHKPWLFDKERPRNGKWRRNKHMMAILALACGACSHEAPPPPPAEVAVIRVQPREATITEDYVAQTEAREAIEIRPRVGGLIEKQAAVEGDKVKRDQLLFVIDPQPYIAALAQAKATLAQAQAASEQAGRDFARVKPLLEIDAVSRQDYDAALAKNEANRASVEAARAELRTAQLNLGYTSVTSPIDGVMGRALLRVGGLVTAYSTQLTTVYSVDPMYVNFSISERRLLEIQKELGRAPNQDVANAPVFHLVLADGSRYPEQARLNFISPAVDRSTGTLAVRLTVANPQRLLRAGQFARVVVAAQTIKDALVVPQRAVQDLQGKNYLWIVDPEQKAQQRDVTMGARMGNDWIVAKGLRPGDTVVVDGAQKLKPGVAVRTVQAPPTPQGGTQP